MKLRGSPPAARGAAGRAWAQSLGPAGNARPIVAIAGATHTPMHEEARGPTRSMSTDRPFPLGHSTLVGLASTGVALRQAASVMHCDVSIASGSIVGPGISKGTTAFPGHCAKTKFWSREHG